jgi:hypothetical protein
VEAFQDGFEPKAPAVSEHPGPPKTPNEVP